ncbi:hypothetical protein C0992_002908 [Termitomyces sp. T32_za158]|nr:hypothetical protein C0992_002908 [Termitomyces sp. T32_za158]
MSPFPAALDVLRRSGIVVASDTAEYHHTSNRRICTAGHTTNPSLVYAAVIKPDGEYTHLIEEAVGFASHDPVPDLDARAQSTCDYLLVQLGIEILKIIPGRVSISIDPLLTHDKRAIIAKAQTLIALFAAHGYAPTRVLIKVPATYTGILACRALAACTPPIDTNATLIFGLVQARACTPELSPPSPSPAHPHPHPHPHPGPALLHTIHAAFDAHGHTAHTTVMAAGFCAADEVVAAAARPDFVTLQGGVVAGPQYTGGCGCRCRF